MQESDINIHSKSKKLKGQYYVTKQKRKYVLDAGLKGFLCSCNFREKDCIKETYNLLNEYADVLFKHQEEQGNKSELSEDMDNLLNEIQTLKTENILEQKRFQVVESGAKNLLFIRTTIDDPVKLVHNIMKDVHEDKKQKTRFLLRLIPIETTCKANVDSIKQACKPLIDKYFSEAPSSYSVVFNHRNNNQLAKLDVIIGIADLVSSTRPDHTVNLKNGQVSIVIEIIRNIALIGVIPDFMKYKKYNIHMSPVEESPKH